MNLYYSIVDLERKVQSYKDKNKKLKLQIDKLQASNNKLQSYNALINKHLSKSKIKSVEKENKELKESLNKLSGLYNKLTRKLKNGK